MSPDAGKFDRLVPRAIHTPNVNTIGVRVHDNASCWFLFGTAIQHHPHARCCEVDTKTRGAVISAIERITLRRHVVGNLVCKQMGITLPMVADNLRS